LRCPSGSTTTGSDATQRAHLWELSRSRANQGELTDPGTAIAFLRRAVAFYRRHGITVEQLLTDNGNPYRSSVHAIACRALGIRHLRTRPYRPQTNGKAERFIRTLLGGWAYGALYRNRSERAAALDGWLEYYNHRRRHSALGHKPPIARLNERTNLLGTYS
jgi:transposase InsO family protein